MQLKSPQLNFWCQLYNFLCLKLLGHWSESHQISTKCTEIIANYSSEIKIVMVQSILKCQCAEWRSIGKLRPSHGKKMHFFNSVNSKIIGNKLTKFIHNLAALLPFNLLKAVPRSSNPLLNARAKTKGCSWWRLQITPKFNWLPQQRPLGNKQIHVWD